MMLSTPYKEGNISYIVATCVLAEATAPLDVADDVKAHWDRLV